MKYKFKKYDISSPNIPKHLKDYDYGVDYDSLSKENIGLFGINSETWTPEILQKIIDESNKLTGNEDYTYQVEGSDFFIAIKKAEVLMWTRESRKPDITWSFTKFISFMEDFKKFVEEVT